jgi:hypothetical protein
MRQPTVEEAKAIVIIVLIAAFVIAGLINMGAL